MAKRKTKKFKGFHNLSAGLFGYRGWYWYKNIGDFWILIKRVFFALKHGYAPQALWETDRWFIGVMREILTNYKDNRVFTGFFFNEGLNEEEDIAKTVLMPGDPLRAKKIAETYLENYRLVLL